MKKSAVLFDLDGTLLDTTDGVLESAVYAAVSLGRDPLPHETMLRFVGPPIQESFMRHYGMDEAGARSALAGTMERFMAANITLKAGDLSIQTTPEDLKISSSKTMSL